MLKKISLFLFMLVFGTYQAFAACGYCDGHDCLEARTDIPKGKGASGKWKDAETPKRDWTCIEVFDREGTDTCEMCEREEVRFVHVMQHGRLKLEVGCFCAAYMDGTLDKAAAKSRESTLISRLSKLKNFMDESKWKESAKGNPYYTFKRSEHNPTTKKVVLMKSKFNSKYAYSIISLSEDGEEQDSYRSEYLVSKEITMKAAFDSIFPLRMRVN
jgi:hypothetical protein